MTTKKPPAGAHPPAPPPERDPEIFGPTAHSRAPGTRRVLLREAKHHAAVAILKGRPWPTDLAELEHLEHLAEQQALAAHPELDPSWLDRVTFALLQAEASRPSPSQTVRDRDLAARLYEAAAVLVETARDMENGTGDWPGLSWLGTELAGRDLGERLPSKRKLALAALDENGPLWALVREPDRGAASRADRGALLRFCLHQLLIGARAAVRERAAAIKSKDMQQATATARARREVIPQLEPVVRGLCARCWLSDRGATFAEGLEQLGAAAAKAGEPGKVATDVALQLSPGLSRNALEEAIKAYRISETAMPLWLTEALGPFARHLRLVEIPPTP